MNIDKAMKRSYLNVRDGLSVLTGAEEFSAHHHVFPDLKLLKQLVHTHAARAKLLLALRFLNCVLM